MEQRRRIPFKGMTLMLVVLVLASALVLWLFARSTAVPEDAAPLAGAPIGGDFSLIDQDGHVVSNDSLMGSYRLVYFGYSFCPDVCPVDVQRMMKGFSAFESAEPARAAKLQPIFITVDPARDTQAALKIFVSAFHPRLIGLTGSADAIEAAKTTYRVYAAKGEGSDAENYLMDHSAYIYLMNPDGTPIMFFERADTAEAIAAGLAKWVK